MLLFQVFVSLNLRHRLLKYRVYHVIVALYEAVCNGIVDISEAVIIVCASLKRQLGNVVYSLVDYLRIFGFHRCAVVLDKRLVRHEVVIECLRQHIGL